jgi:hypothetical protein
MCDLKLLVQKVREADKAHGDYMMSGYNAAEPALWQARIQARTELRDAVYEQLGINADELARLTQG